MGVINYRFVKKSLALLKILFLKPSLTFKLLTFTRIKNAFNFFYYREGHIDLLFDRYKNLYNSEGADIDEKLYSVESYVGDIVIFPAIDWAYRFQRPQHIAKELSLKGYRVFYISLVPKISESDMDYLIQGNPVSSVVLVQLSSDGHKIPDFYFEGLTADMSSAFLKSYQKLSIDFNIVSPNVIVQQPAWWPFAEKIISKNIIYDCIDYHAGFHEKTSAMLESNEKNLVSSASSVVATSSWLANSLGRHCEKVHIIRNACEFDRFSSSIKNNNKDYPVIGYVGAISHWFDIELLLGVASSRPDWKFDIYGATVGADINSLRSLPNVHFWGEIPYEAVAETICKFDVCIIPFKVNELTLATNPVKIYEYLACGLPVVSTKLPELDGMEDVDIFCANSSEQFLDYLSHAVEISTVPNRVQIRKDWAMKNDWSIRAEQFIDLMV